MGRNGSKSCRLGWDACDVQTFLMAAVAVVAAVAYVLIKHPLLWRWLSGHPLDGKHRTNATWLHPATKVHHPTPVVRWHHLPRLTRTAIRTGLTLAALAAGWGHVTNPQVTDLVIICLGCVCAVFAGWRIVRALRRARHHRRWVTPLHRALAPVLGVNLAERPGSWLQVEPDRSAATIALPASFATSPARRGAITEVVKAKLALEAPEVTWDERGHRPVVRFRSAPPPPRRAGIDDLMPAIEAAGPADLVLGLGRGGKPVIVSLDGDSPHLMLSMGSGAGKSVLGRLIGAQSKYRGGVLLVWDYKLISQNWCKGLPGVVYCKTEAEIHASALWLEAEIKRRNKVADAGADIEGNVHANVGPRIVVLAEELNATMARLRAYWREHGDDNRSPAVEAIDAALFMGRQVRCNIVQIGQLITAGTAGSSAGRENIGVRVLGRYTKNAWKMLVPEVQPMPPSNNTPGRVQVVTGGVARETQTGFLTGYQARRLATAGEVSLWPSPIPGMPHLTPVPDGTPIENSQADLGSVSVTLPPELPSCDAIRLSDAVALGIVSISLAAVRKASHRDSAFPEPAGWQGIARTYDAEQLRAWEDGRPRSGRAREDVPS